MRILSSPVLIALTLGSSRLLLAQSGPDIVWQTNAHFSGVTSVAFAGDSQRLASGSPDRYAKVWDVVTSDLIRDFHTPNEWVLAVALSFDGSLLATGGDEGKTRAWRVADGARLWIGGPDDEFVYSVSFAPDDSLLCISRSDGINMRYAESGSGILFGEPEGEVFGICFAPDGTALASANQNQNASLWSVATGTLVRDFVGHSNEVHSVDFSPDGTLLATASADGTARIWNVTNGAPLQILEGGGGAAKFSADGKLLYTLNDGTFKIWRVFNGACVGSITNTDAISSNLGFGRYFAFDVAKNGKYFAYGTGGGAVVLARMPVIINSFTRTGNEAILSWQGGSGLYQLQSRTNLMQGSWENLGNATTNTVATNLSSIPLFFRVQSLPQP